MPYVSLSPAISGALAYLDAVATPEQKQTAANQGQGSGHERPGETNHVRRELRLEVDRAFKLGGYVGHVSTLAKEMEAFRLFWSEDCADALAAAWCLMQRGGDPEDALRANYDFQGAGVLTPMTRAELAVVDEKPGLVNWAQLRGHYRDGDRIASYSYGGGCGYIIVRGRRLVLDYETLHFQLSPEGAARMVEEVKQFEAVGGTAAFLAGTLVWPPPGGIVYPPCPDASAFECERCDGG